MPTKLLAADTLLTMTGSALVAHFNQLVEEHPELEIRPVNRFATGAVAQRRIADLYASIKGAAADRATDTDTAEAPAAAEPSDTTTVDVDKHSKESKMATSARKKTATTKKAKTETNHRGFAEDAKIKVLVKENPRRGDAAKRFELYKNGMTVAEYTKKIGSRAEALVHLRWDVNKGHISVG